MTFRSHLSGDPLLYTGDETSLPPDKGNLTPVSHLIFIYRTLPVSATCIFFEENITESDRGFAAGAGLWGRYSGAETPSA
jgi:hypothetical protein